MRLSLGPRSMPGASGLSARSSKSFVVGITIACALLLSGCGAAATAPSASPTTARSPESTPSASPTPEPDPVLVVGGTAGQNRPYFEFVIEGLLASTSQPSSSAIVDALVAAGFDRAALQVTADTTRVGDPADSILFSVLIDGQCLLGQVAQGTLQSELADVLGTGQCLVGRTVSLD